MASRQEQKARAREVRLAAARADEAAATRRRRLQRQAGIVVLTVVSVGVVIAVAAGTRGGIAHGPKERRIYAQVDGLLRGIPQRGETLGASTAPYTLTFFGDLQCPVCAAFATGTQLGGITGGLPQFISAQVRAGRARVVYRSLCTATCADDGEAAFVRQQADAYAAGEQGRFWYYEELFSRQQGPEGSGYVTDTFLRSLAREIPGLTYSIWSRDRAAPALRAQLTDDARAAVARLPLEGGGRGTPGLIVSGPGGSTVVGEGMADYGQLQAAMRQVS